MAYIFSVFFLIALLFSQSFGFNGGRCGTLHFAESIKNPSKKILAKPCKVNDNLNPTMINSRTSEHFIIYYTTTGSHKAGGPSVSSEVYIDTLIFYLEKAYKLHKDSLGMKNMISGISPTYQYNKRVPPGLYPIEVIDTGLLRGNEGEYSQTFGLTFTSDALSKATQIAIENDFLYGADCSGAPSIKPFFSVTGLDYSKHWNLALKVTVFHELYHAFQRTYYDWAAKDRPRSFWLEASATGVEEIGAPDVDDYIGYLEDFFDNRGRPMEDPLDDGYSYSVLYLFLFSEFGSKFDSSIWDYFSKYPKENFSTQLARFANSRGRDAGDLFNQFASEIFFSGERTKYKKPFWSDMPKWRYEWDLPLLPEERVVSLPAGAFDFYRTANELEPNTNSVVRKNHLFYGDSSVWVFSHLPGPPNSPGPKVPTKEFIAYPNPWNPKRHSKVVYFKHPPEGANEVEIRTSNGALLERIKKSEETDTLLIWQPKKTPAPGILYYRYLPHGKNKVLITEY